MSEIRSIGPVLGVVLAGGQSRRMGADKGLIPLAGKPLVAHAIERLRSQVRALVVNTNADEARYVAFGVTVIADPLDGFPGPLAGLLSGMRHAARFFPDVTHIATVAVDTPFFPCDCVRRLAAAIEATAGSRLAFAVTHTGPQPVFALADVALADALQRDIVSGKARRVVDWLRARPHVQVHFAETEAFFNVNTPEDLAVAEAMARG